MRITCGIDIVHLASFQKAMEQKGFLKRVFTAGEIQYCKSTSAPTEHFAGRFAAKEAVIKALGKSVPYGAMEIQRTNTGQPVLSFHNKAEKGAQCSVSITHAKDYAAALAVCYDQFQS